MSLRPSPCPFYYVLRSHALGVNGMSVNMAMISVNESSSNIPNLSNIGRNPSNSRKEIGS